MFLLYIFTEANSKHFGLIFGVKDNFNFELFKWMHNYEYSAR